MKYYPVLSTLLALAVLMSGAPAQAHSLHVFAWLENSQVVVEGSFGKARPAINADVTVQDATTHQEVLTGRTDANGRFSFAVPEAARLGHPLVIVVNAGQGHQGQWRLNAQGLNAAASRAADSETATMPDQAATAPRTAARPSVPDAVPTGHLRDIVRQELEAQLAPIRQELASQAVRGAGLTEIIGGLGWIIGLVGIGLYFKSRNS